MTLTQLHYLITIAETKSLNKAAELLYVSQPSLTNAMKELEKELGLKHQSQFLFQFLHGIGQRRL